jgi:prepilin-type N-terminal cleavage/methylation domain-containing protein
VNVLTTQASRPTSAGRDALQIGVVAMSHFHFHVVPRHRALRRGLSLVELIVCIAIVAMLIGLLLPAMGGMRAASRAAQCMSQLRQLMLAAEHYRGINDSRYPPALLYAYTPEGVVTIAWDFAQHPDGTITAGPLWSMLDHPGEIMQDPGFSGESTFGGDPYTGFNYNTTFIGAEGNYPTVADDGVTILDEWDTCRPGLPAAACRRTSTTALFGLGGWSGGANKFMRAPMNTVEGNLALVYAGGQAFRHRGATLVVHLDGNLERVAQPCKGLLATPELLSSPMQHPDNGFLSEDDDAYDPR